MAFLPCYIDLKKRHSIGSKCTDYETTKSQTNNNISTAMLLDIVSTTPLLSDFESPTYLDHLPGNMFTREAIELDLCNDNEFELDDMVALDDSIQSEKYLKPWRSYLAYIVIACKAIYVDIW